MRKKSRAIGASACFAVSAGRSLACCWWVRSGCWDSRYCAAIRYIALRLEIDRERGVVAIEIDIDIIVCTAIECKKKNDQRAKKYLKPSSHEVWWLNECYHKYIASR